MADGSMGDRLLNKFGERAQVWASISDNDDILSGKVVLRARANFLAARKEAFDYVKALERTVAEVELENTDLNAKLADALGAYRSLELVNSSLQADLDDSRDAFTRVSKELEGRNRLNEKGPDQIGADYILRLGIPELTEVFNRTVLGHK